MINFKVKHFNSKINFIDQNDYLKVKGAFSGNLDKPFSGRAME